MHIIKRAVLSVTRQSGKTLILFLVILIVGTLVAGMVSVRQAISQFEENAKLSFGATVSIGIDEQAFLDAYNAGKEPEVHSISSELIEELGRRPEVKNFDYSLICSLGSKTLKNYEINNSSVFINPDSDSDYSAYFILHGIQYAPVMPVEEGKLSIIDGRVFNQDEITTGKMVALVSKKMAEINNLHVGDTFVLVNEVIDYSKTNNYQEGRIVDSHDVVLEIIGIFEPNSGSKAPATSNYSSGVKLSQQYDYETYNSIYVPIKVTQAEDLFVMECRCKMAEDAGEYLSMEEYEPYYTPLYMLNSVDDIESFTQAASHLLPEYYMVLSAQSQFNQIAGQMLKVQQIMTIALVATLLAALLIISLLIVFFLRDRRKEFGIYLSLGVRKSQLIRQVLLEVFIIAVLSLSVSLFTGYLVSDSISQQLALSQLSSQQEPGLSNGPYLGLDADLMIGSLSSAITNYRISFGAQYIVTFLCLGVGTTMFSCIIPLSYILRLKPKKILM